MKQFLLLIGSAVLLLSCGSNYKQSNVQVVIDSAVNAKVAAHDADNARKNDSTINAEARIKAAAMESQMNLENKKAKKDTPKSAATTPASKSTPAN